MRTLFVCTGNTCRSPMAERLARHLFPQHSWESAGVIPADGMHHMTRRVLKEIGADTDGFSSHDVNGLDLGGYDVVVLIGETARTLAPDPPDGVQVHHWDVDDPYEVVGTNDVVLAAYENCRSELEILIRGLVGEF